MTIRRKGGHKNWQCVNAIKQQRAGSHQRRAHGLRDIEAERLRDGKTCAICGTAERLNVDHCNNAKAIRGVVCHRCNTGLGHFRDDPELLAAAARYIAEFREAHAHLVEQWVFRPAADRWGKELSHPPAAT